MTTYQVIDENELKEKLFHDFQLIRAMRAPDEIKIKILSTLFSLNPNCWRVIGITSDALKVFAENKFKKISKMGINRSHIVQRYKFYHFLLSREFSDCNEFWDCYFNNDVTILATSKENMSKNSNIVNVAYLVPSNDDNLFRTSGYAWTHKEKEQEFLSKLTECIQKNEQIPLLVEDINFKNLELFDPEDKEIKRRF